MEAGGAMAEVGLLPFARIALQVSRVVLPRYRSRFSKHQFTQPQLLAILCRMRYEDWTFREAEVRLGEHRELRQTLGLIRVPDFTTLYRFLQRLDDLVIDRAVGETVRRLRGTQKKKRRREESHLHTPRTGSTECDSSEAGEENMAFPRSASGDATGIPPTNLSASRADRKRLLLGQAQAFGSGAGPQPAHAEASSPAAR